MAKAEIRSGDEGDDADLGSDGDVGDWDNSSSLDSTSSEGANIPRAEKCDYNLEKYDYNLYIQ